MGDLTRHASAMDDWWLDLPKPQAADNWDPEMGELKASVLTDNLAAVRENLAEGDTMLADACRWLEERDDLQALADLAATVQDLKRSLAVAEAYISRTAGAVRSSGVTPPDALTDGRPFELRRSTTRKRWDHGGWKSAVLNAVLERHEVAKGDVTVNASTGEPVDVPAIIQAAQEVHGSTSPRVTNLKALGIDPGDFCEETPGPWSVSVIQPTK